MFEGASQPLSVGKVSQPYQTPINPRTLLKAVRPQAELLNRSWDYPPLVAVPMTQGKMADETFADDWEDEYAYTTEMCRRYIIPNWYLPEHFDEMEGWNEARVNEFKEYLTKVICAYDSVKQFVQEVIYSFNQEYPEEDDGA